MIFIMTLPENATRRRIRRCVRSRPGIHFNELVRELDLAPGQAQYHVYSLLDDDSIASSQLYGRTHYYPPAYDEWERGVLALFRRETAREIMLYLLENEGGRATEVADAIDVARSTAEWHLDHLIERDVVEKRYDERGRATLELRHPERTARVLEAVEPSLSDRLVDRFTRLIDRVVDESTEDSNAS